MEKSIKLLYNIPSKSKLEVDYMATNVLHMSVSDRLELLSELRSLLDNHYLPKEVVNQIHGLIQSIIQSFK